MCQSVFRYKQNSRQPICITRGISPTTKATGGIETMRVAQVRLGIVLGILVVLLFGSVAQTYGYVDHLIRKVEHGELEECIFAMARLGELGEEWCQCCSNSNQLIFWFAY